MIDKGSVARRPLDVEDYIDILRRNVSWIVGPVFAGLIIATVVAYLLQDTYISHALIRIVPQQISDSLVQNASAQDMTGRIESLAASILSRTTLSNLITSLGLYKSEQKNGPMEDVVNKMHEAIGLHTSMGMGNPQNKGGGMILEITFKYRDRMLANKVCSELVTKFLDSTSEGSNETQKQANDFLVRERDKAKAELDIAEQSLTEYRGKHVGALPEEMQSNMAQMSATQQRLNSLSDADSRASEQRLMIQTALRSAKDRVSSLRQITPVSVTRNERNTELDKQIADLETAIASMKDRYTADYPDLQTAEERLGVLRRQRDESSKAPVKPSDTDNPMMARERMDAQAQVDQLEGQLKALTIGEQQISKEILEANGQLRTLQSRLSASPAGEKEYMDLLQARETSRAKYIDLDQKAQKSEISKDLESAKQGETLELIDPASLPIDPTEPKRWIYIALGAVGGLFLGIILVAIREVKDTSLKNLKDARVYTQLSVLGSIPLLENDVVVQRRKQVAMVSWATAVVVGIVIMAGSVAHYYMSKV